jgi:hypothetical protein
MTLLVPREQEMANRTLKGFECAPPFRLRRPIYNKTRRDMSGAAGAFVNVDIDHADQLKAERLHSSPRDHFPPSQARTNRATTATPYHTASRLQLRGASGGFPSKVSHIQAA